MVTSSLGVELPIESESGERPEVCVLSNLELADRKLSEMMIEAAHVKRLKAECKKGEARVLELKAQFDVLISP